MIIGDLAIPGIKIIKPDIYEDDRGFFFESFNQKSFRKLIKKDITFVQDNQSLSKKGVIRGMHYQIAPYAQAKLVRVIHGEIFDVALDINQKSFTYGKWIGKILSSQSKEQLWIPEGFAHGYLVLSDYAEVVYKTTNYYSKEHQRFIRYDDNKYSIKWPKMKKYFLSNSDLTASNS